MSESQGHEYLKTHQISGEALLVDISSEAEAVLDEAKRESTGHTARTLVKEGPLRLVLLGLRQGASIREHRADGPVSIHLLSGSVEIARPGRQEQLSEGQALMLGAAVSHSVEARADSVLLVTIAQASE